MTTAQAKQKFYHKYAIGEMNMAEAELGVQLNNLTNDIERNKKRAQRRAFMQDKKYLALNIN